MSSVRELKAGLAALTVAIALSQFAPAPALAADAAVRIAGQTVFVNKAASAGMTAQARADVIQKNLDNALVAAKDRTPAAVNIVYVKGLPVITLGGYQVATVDAANAKLAGTTPAVLAQRWADGLRNALKDQGSIDSYIGQLTGGYQSSAPAVAQQPSQTPPANYAQPPQQQPNYGGQPNYGASGAPQGYGAPSYGGQPGGYGQPSYGGQVQQSYNPPAYGQPGSYDQYNTNPGGGQGGYPVQRGRVVYAPAGLVMPVSLQTSISTQAASSGDLVQATLSQPIALGDSQIPAGSTLIGNITEAKAGGFLGRSGMMGLKFNRLRTPDGVEAPISAHIVGGIGKYSDIGGDSGDTFKGEGWGTKFGQAGLRTAIGAGGGAALGTAVGAIAGGRRGVGRGAWSGTAIGGGVGLVDSLVLRKGKDVVIKAGTQMQVQLDAPLSISGGGTPPYTGAF